MDLFEREALGAPLVGHHLNHVFIESNQATQERTLLATGQRQLRPDSSADHSLEVRALPQRSVDARRRDLEHVTPGHRIVGIQYIAHLPADLLAVGDRNRAVRLQTIQVDTQQAAGGSAAEFDLEYFESEFRGDRLGQ